MIGGLHRLVVYNWLSNLSLEIEALVSINFYCFASILLQINWYKDHAFIHLKPFMKQATITSVPYYNYAFLVHVRYHLKKDGDTSLLVQVIALVLSGNGVYFDQDICH